jgi:two-component system chemotaxis response regulator CheY
VTIPQSVLIVDDDSGVRGLLRYILEEAGYQVMEAENGREAMRVLREHSVHLVLIDLVMPVQEGLETIPQIKAAFPATRIIAMSGAFGGTLLPTAKALGAHEALSKPMLPEMLLNKVRQVLAE